MKALRGIVVLALAGLLLLPLSASAATAKQEDLVRLVKLTGGVQLAHQTITMTMTQSMDLVRKAHPELSKEFFALFLQEFQKEQGTFVDELVGATAKVWGRYLTEEDTLELIELYQRPVMQKATGLLPQISKDVMLIGGQAGKEMAERVLPRVVHRLKDEHGISLKE